MGVRRWLAGGGVALSVALAVLGAASCESSGRAPHADELVGSARQAITGVCDSTAAAPQACIDAVQANGGVVNDIFKDANGLTAAELPLFGKLFNAWPGCPTVASAGCAGQSLAPYSCPGQYQCNSVPNTFENGSAYLNALDRLWWQPCRLSNHDVGPDGCPVWASCVPDGSPGNYFPWEGLVFDLGGPSNKVAIFAENDHGPQPCESLEYTIYLTDNPYSKDKIEQPAVTGVDPQKWNRAVLTKIYTKGFAEIRPPDPVNFASCGDTALYSVEEDSFAQVFSLPCGITFRYASIIAGNDALDFSECGFDSQEAELDAVAGLTEAGSGVCPDADGDHFVDCNCPGAPPECDCNDADPAVHPGAPEACDAPDLNCDDQPGACSAGLFCHDSICIPPCGGGETPCPIGSTCVSTDQGDLCVPDDCTVGGCPPGSTCVNGICVPPCEDVVCPGKLVCQDGKCVDPCMGVQCPPPQVCQSGVCAAPCDCFAPEAGCVGFPGTVCDKGNTDLCVPQACLGVMCAPGESCDGATGMCVPFCSDDVVCPLGQKCVAPEGCVPLCAGVSCDPGLECDPATGDCVDLSCADVVCFDGEVCKNGECVPGPSTTSGSGGSGGGAAGGRGGAGAGTDGGRGGADPGDDGSCGCRMAGSERAPGSLALGFAMAAALTALRRRPRRRAARD